MRVQSVQTSFQITQIPQHQRLRIQRMNNTNTSIHSPWINQQPTPCSTHLIRRTGGQNILSEGTETDTIDFSRMSFDRMSWCGIGWVSRVPTSKQSSKPSTHKHHQTLIIAHRRKNGIVKSMPVHVLSRKFQSLMIKVPRPRHCGLWKSCARLEIDFLWCRRWHPYMVAVDWHIESILSSIWRKPLTNCCIFRGTDNVTLL